MKILVTGGAGFIGSHVVEAYHTAGHSVAVLDDFSTGKRENIPSDVPVFEGSITDAEFVEKTLSKFQPDVVNHHAAQISVTYSVSFPRKDAERNILGTITLLNAVVTHAPHAKCIYASSGGAMYGVLQEQPYNETSTPAAQSPYGLSKHVAERYIWLFAQLHGLRATVLRYSNVYGPRQDPHGEAGVCAIFTNRMHQGEDVTIYGDGSAVRDYVFVHDVAQANLSALTLGDGESFNISTGIASSTNQVFTLLKDAFKYPREPHFEPLRPGEVTSSVLDPSKAEKILGWKAQHKLSEGIPLTVSWRQEQQ